MQAFAARGFLSKYTTPDEYSTATIRVLHKFKEISTVSVAKDGASPANLITKQQIMGEKVNAGAICGV